MKINTYQYHICSFNRYNIPFCSLKNTSTDEISRLTEQLENVLQGEVYLPVSNWKEFLPPDAKENETIKKLQELFECSKFFSRVPTNERRYGKNFNFAFMAEALCQKAAKSMLDGDSFENTLTLISSGYAEENKINTSMYENKYRLGKTGVYRGDNLPPRYIGRNRDDNFVGGYGKNTYGYEYAAYVKRLNENVNNRISPYENFTLTKKVPGDAHILIFPYHEEVPVNMKIIEKRYKIYQCILNEYKRTGRLTAEQITQADKIISEIYFLMANTCPYHRGSNGICDILMRSQYSALGINKPHVKYGVGLDLEAFCMNLEEYKSKWNSFFEESK